MAFFVGNVSAAPVNAPSLTINTEQWREENCRSCIPGNGEINVDESYFFSASGTQGTITLPPVVPCANNPISGLSCHSGFFFQYGIVMKWKGNKTALPTLNVPNAVSVQAIYDFTVRRNGEWITCVDLTIDPIREGVIPTLTVTGTATVSVTGVLRYRFPQYIDWCLAYQR